MLKRRHDAEIDVHGLIVFCRGVSGIGYKGTERSRHRQRRKSKATQVGQGVECSKQAGGNRLGIPLGAGDLTRKTDASVALERKGLIEAGRRIDEGVAVHDAIPEELALLKARNHAEHASLLRPGEVCLEAHKVVGRALPVLSAQLHHRPRPAPRARVDDADRLEGTETKGVVAGARDLLSRLTGLEKLAPLEIAQDGPLGAHELVDESVVFLFVHGAVEIVVAIPLVITGHGEDLLAVKRGGIDDGRGGIEERQLLASHKALDRLGKGTRAQRSRRHDDRTALGKLDHFLSDEFDERLGGHGLLDEGGEDVPVDRKGPSRRHRSLLGKPDKGRPQARELSLQQAGGRVGAQGLERVRAHELSQVVSLMRGRTCLGTHLVEFHGDAPLCKRQGAFASCQACTDDDDAVCNRVHVSRFLSRLCTVYVR